MSALPLAALATEAVFGWPARVHHPVEAIGALIDRLDRAWNHGRSRRIKGIAALAVVAGAGWLGGRAARALGPDTALAAASAALAQRSLHTHVRAVERALADGDLARARTEVARIVGRDTAALDAGGIARAAIESLAESFNDGVVAPAFWLWAGGPAAAWAYKAINTADSMIGHRTPRHEWFGWASARADDLLNLAPARLAGALIVVAGGGGWRVMLRDARAHASPNAGWPEAAMAGALGLGLGGPVSYDGEPTDRPWFGDGRDPEGATDISRALEVYRRACALVWLLAGVRTCRR